MSTTLEERPERTPTAEILVLSLRCRSELGGWVDAEFGSVQDFAVSQGEHRAAAGWRHLQRLRGTLTTIGVSGSPQFILNNTGSQGGGVAAANSTATTMTQTAVTVNTSNNCVGSETPPRSYSLEVDTFRFDDKQSNDVRTKPACSHSCELQARLPSDELLILPQLDH